MFTNYKSLEALKHLNLLNKFKLTDMGKAANLATINLKKSSMAVCYSILNDSNQAINDNQSIL